MFEETVMHVQDRPIPSVPALAPTRYGADPAMLTAAPITMNAAPIFVGGGLQGEFEQEAE